MRGQLTSRRQFLGGSLALTGLGLLAGCALPPMLGGKPKAARIGWLGISRVGGGPDRRRWVGRVRTSWPNCCWLPGPLGALAGFATGQQTN